MPFEYEVDVQNVIVRHGRTVIVKWRHIVNTTILGHGCFTFLQPNSDTKLVKQFQALLHCYNHKQTYDIEFGDKLIVQVSVDKEQNLTFRVFSGGMYFPVLISIIPYHPIDCLMVTNMLTELVNKLV